MYGPIHQELNGGIKEKTSPDLMSTSTTGRKLLLHTGTPCPTYGKGRDHSRAVQSPVSQLILTTSSHQGMNSAMRHLGPDLQDPNSEAETSELQVLSECRDCPKQQPRAGSSRLEPAQGVLPAPSRGPASPPPGDARVKKLP